MGLHKNGYSWDEVKRIEALKNHNIRDSNFLILYDSIARNTSES